MASAPLVAIALFALRLRFGHTLLQSVIGNFVYDLLIFDFLLPFRFVQRVSRIL